MTGESDSTARIASTTGVRDDAKRPPVQNSSELPRRPSSETKRASSPSASTDSRPAWTPTIAAAATSATAASAKRDARGLRQVDIATRSAVPNRNDFELLATPAARHET